MLRYLVLTLAFSAVALANIDAITDAVSDAGAAHIAMSTSSVARRSESSSVASSAPRVQDTAIFVQGDSYLTPDCSGTLKNTVWVQSGVCLALGPSSVLVTVNADNSMKYCHYNMSGDQTCSTTPAECRTAPQTGYCDSDDGVTSTKFTYPSTTTNFVKLYTYADGSCGTLNSGPLLLPVGQCYPAGTSGLKFNTDNTLCYYALDTTCTITAQCQPVSNNVCNTGTTSSIKLVWSAANSLQVNLVAMLGAAVFALLFSKF